jgi:2-polyprenyl-6-methoxyphenol hydroxylase-like FAD-dependent oxidoreductase
MRFGRCWAADPVVARRVGRIALAGDAAHDNSSLGGQRTNTGIGDAVELAAALDVALQTDSPDRSTRMLAFASRRFAWQLSALVYR